MGISVSRTRQRDARLITRRYGPNGCSMKQRHRLRRNAQGQPDTRVLGAHLDRNHPLRGAHRHHRHKFALPPRIRRVGGHAATQPAQPPWQRCQGKQESPHQEQLLGHVRCLVFADAAQTLGGRHDVSQANTEFVIDHHHLALGDQIAINQYVHGFASQRVQLHY